MRDTTIAAVLVLGVALAVRPLPAIAGAGDGTLPGPMAAIAKARAAAEKEGQRAAAHDAQAAQTFDDAPRGTTSRTAPVPEPGADVVAAPEQQAHAATDGDGSRPTYDPSAHRDPFRPPRLNAVADARTPLQTYQLGQLKLVGVIAQPSFGYRAMVEDSAGLGYIITTGTPIGSSGGVVRSIEPRRVIIEESTRDFYGDVKPKEVVMELPQEDRSP